MARRRVLLSLDDELYEILKVLAKESGIPAATYITHLLGSIRSELTEITTALQQGKQGLRAELARRSRKHP